jgi:hypothetical protein
MLRYARRLMRAGSEARVAAASLAAFGHHDPLTRHCQVSYHLTRPVTLKSSHYGAHGNRNDQILPAAPVPLPAFAVPTTLRTIAPTTPEAS